MDTELIEAPRQGRRRVDCYDLIIFEHVTRTTGSKREERVRNIYSENVPVCFSCIDLLRVQICSFYSTIMVLFGFL